MVQSGLLVIMGIYIVLFYQFLSKLEPFCFYLPGCIGQFYKVHKDVKTKFDDIIGAGDIKDELRGHLKYFREKNLTKGFLFQGQSGTGKTLMAKAVAGESSLPFIEIFTNNLRYAHIPTVLNAVIKKYSPCIIFIDECNSIIGEFNDTFLRKLDGIESIKNVFLILATTRCVDSAICRSGRIDKTIHFQLPTHNDRVEMFLKFGYNENNALQLAERTGDFTYADISIIPRETDFIKLVKEVDNSQATDQAINHIKFGRHTSRHVLNPETKSRLAYHEIGHLLVACLLKDVEKPYNITLTPEGKVAGNVLFNSDDLICTTRSDILKRIAVCLASSTFETHYLGEYSTFCEDDFKMIDELFKIMNRSRMLGYNFLSIISNDEPVFIDILSKLEDIIRDVIIKYNDIILTLHAELMYHQSLNEKQIKHIIGNVYDTMDLPKI